MKKQNITGRRKFLKGLGAGAIVGLSPFAGLPRIAMAQSSSNGVMVVLFQRGGCDGLNTLVPIDNSTSYGLDAEGNPITDWAWYTKHRPDVHISNALPIAGQSQFGLHPALAPLQTTIDQNHFTFFPATHTDIDLSAGRFGNMSHFSAQEIMESGATGSDLGQIKAEIAQADIKAGWVARSLSAVGPAEINGFGFSGVDSLQGDPSILTFADLRAGITSDWANDEFVSGLVDGYLEGCDIEQIRLDNPLLDEFGISDEDVVAFFCTSEESLVTNLNNVSPINRNKEKWRMYLKSLNEERTSSDGNLCDSSTTLNHEYYCTEAELANDLARETEKNMLNKADHAIYSYNANTQGPEYTRGYTRGGLGLQLEQAAALIKGVDELQIVTVEDGGYDHHSDIVSSMNGKLGGLAQNLQAFRDDLAGFGKPVQVVVMTEFGRTVDQNGDDAKMNWGTDHGQASCAMVMGAGASVAKGSNVCFGGRNGYTAGWPGLSELSVQSAGSGPRYYLNAVTDYRDILTSLLVHTVGVPQWESEGVFRSIDANYQYQSIPYFL